MIYWPDIFSEAQKRQESLSVISSEAAADSRLERETPEVIVEHIQRSKGLQPPDDASYAVVGEGGDRLVVLPVRVLPRDSLGELFRHHLSEMQLDIYMIPPPWQWIRVLL